LTVISGPLSIVASADLGDLGPHKSEPVAVEWRWHYHWQWNYHWPVLSGWIIVGALLVLIKENRSRQAWLILIPSLLLSAVLWPWIQRQFSLPSDVAQLFGFPFQWLVAAWTAVWLLSPWLARRRPVVAFASAVGLFAMVGIVAQFGVLRNRGQSLRIYGIAVFALLLASVLSSYSCRKSYRPARFLAWLLPWLIIGVMAGLIYEFIWLDGLLASAPSIPELVVRIIFTVPLCAGVLLYLLNLPFMILAFRCPTYRDRLHKLLRLPEPPPPPVAPAACSEMEGEPT
jgi:hypothetical protein